MERGAEGRRRDRWGRGGRRQLQPPDQSPHYSWQNGANNLLIPPSVRRGLRRPWKPRHWLAYGPMQLGKGRGGWRRKGWMGMHAGVWARGASDNAESRMSQNLQMKKWLHACFIETERKRRDASISRNHFLIAVLPVIWQDSPWAQFHQHLSHKTQSLFKDFLFF